MTYIFAKKITIVGSEHGLSPGRRQAIFWTNARIVLIRTLGANLGEILSGIHAVSFKKMQKMHLKMSSVKWRQFSVGLNVLIDENNNSESLPGRGGRYFYQRW